MRKGLFVAFVLVMLIFIGGLLFIARQNFNRDFAAASQAIEERQIYVLATLLHATPEG